MANPWAGWTPELNFAILSLGRIFLSYQGLEASGAPKARRSQPTAAQEAILVPIQGAFTSVDLEPLIRGMIHRWVNREGLSVLDNEIHRLSSTLPIGEVPRK